MMKKNAGFLNLFILEILAKGTEYEEDVETIIGKYERIADLGPGVIIVDHSSYGQYIDDEDLLTKSVSVDYNIDRTNRMLDDAIRLMYVHPSHIIKADYAIDGIIKTLINNISSEELIKEIILNYKYIDRRKTASLMYGQVLIEDSKNH